HVVVACIKLAVAVDGLIVVVVVVVDVVVAAAYNVYFVDNLPFIFFLLQ
uniref:Uncharacterized protein n=1 Tax=Panagrolaimus sp. ES5 TaxID=591445 RepID=A0AC34GKP8_9BILA